MSDDLSALSDFARHRPAVPAAEPGAVPARVQPLHIFEPRYRQMTADALAGDRLIALVLLRPGWEEDYDAAAGRHPSPAWAKSSPTQSLPDGRYNLLLRGLARVRIVEELQTTSRTARPVSRCWRTRAAETSDGLMACDGGLAELVLAAVRRRARSASRFASCSMANCRSATFRRPLFRPAAAAGSKQGLLGDATWTCRARTSDWRRLRSPQRPAKPTGQPARQAKFPPDFSVTECQSPGVRFTATSSIPHAGRYTSEPALRTTSMQKRAARRHVQGQPDDPGRPADSRPATRPRTSRPPTALDDASPRRHAGQGPAVQRRAVARHAGVQHADARSSTRAWPT